jgi:hypothetical protein
MGDSTARYSDFRWWTQLAGSSRANEGPVYEGAREKHSAETGILHSGSEIHVILTK